MPHDYSSEIRLDHTPEGVYDAVIDVPADGRERRRDSTTAGSEFDYAYQDVHDCRIR